MITGKWLGGKEDLFPAYLVRYLVFAKEQGYSMDEDRDEVDQRAIHAVLYQDSNTPIATARVFIDDEGYWHIGRVCVLKEMRGKQIGDLLMRMVLDKILSAGGKHIRLGAQADKVEFYSKYGFTPYGEAYDEEGNPHRHMEASDESVRAAIFSGCKSSKGMV